MTQEKRLEAELDEALEGDAVIEDAGLEEEETGPDGGLDGELNREADEELAPAQDGLEQEALATAPHPNPVIRFLIALKQFAVDFYQANFKADPNESSSAPIKGSKIDSSPRALRKDFERRSKRSVGHITGNSVSSTRGNATRRKKVRITAKTYKPELDRF